jgi:hypothetical protein
MASHDPTNVDAQWESFMASLKNEDFCHTDENKGSEYNCRDISFTVSDLKATGTSASLPFVSGEMLHDFDVALNAYNVVGNAVGVSSEEGKPKAAAYNCRDSSFTVRDAAATGTSASLPFVSGEMRYGFDDVLNNVLGNAVGMSAEERTPKTFTVSDSTGTGTMGNETKSSCHHEGKAY